MARKAKGCYEGQRKELAAWLDWYGLAEPCGVTAESLAGALLNLIEQIQGAKAAGRLDEVVDLNIMASKPPTPLAAAPVGLSRREEFMETSERMADGQCAFLRFYQVLGSSHMELDSNLAIETLGDFFADCQQMMQRFLADREWQAQVAALSAPGIVTGES